MTRKSKRLITETPTPEDAEAIFAQYAKADAKIQSITAEMDKKVIKIREQYDNELTELAQAKEESFERLQHFATKNPDLFAKKKSFEMTHGVIGFRTGTPALKTLKGFTWNAVTNLLKEYLPNYVRVKEEPNKEALLAEKDNAEVTALWSKVGIKLEQSESFYVEPKKETI